MKLLIDSIIIRNFRSFGDYDTVIDLKKRGPILVVGEVDGDVNKSNGAGKSSFIEAIIWCLFGRLSDIHNPGDNVVNWHVGKDCMVRIHTSDGYEITRTRKMDGHSDLLVTKGDVPIDMNDATNKIAQNSLNKMFGLDFDSFISSTFFGQSSGSFIGLSDKKQKNVIEKIFGLSKLKHYAEAAKSLLLEGEAKSNSLRANRDEIERSIEKVSASIHEAKEDHDKYEKSRDDNVRELKEKLSRHESELKEYKPVDVDSLKSEWEEIKDLNVTLKSMLETLQSHNSDIESLKSDLMKIESDKNDKLVEIERRKAAQYKRLITEKSEKIASIRSKVDLKISELRDKKSAAQVTIALHEKSLEEFNKVAAMAGKACPTCGREYDEGYISDKTVEIGDRDKIIEDLNKYAAAMKSIDDAITKLQGSLNKFVGDGGVDDSLLNEEMESEKKITISKYDESRLELEGKIANAASSKEETHKSALDIKQKIDQLTEGKMTVNEAIAHNKMIASINESIIDVNESIKNEKNKINPYVEIIDKLASDLSTKSEEFSSMETSIDEIDKKVSHLQLIHRAYNDKRNIRSYLVSNLVPKLNSRLSYYFNELSVNSDMKFNDYLQMTSDRWPHNFHSGGEKKRVDLALMCALYDTFVSIYGSSCNLLILDEIDKELDKDGVDEYVRLIMDDLSMRVDTILVISHKNEINHLFPRQIKFIKDDVYSYVRDDDEPRSDEQSEINNSQADG